MSIQTYVCTMCKSSFRRYKIRSRDPFCTYKCFQDWRVLKTTNQDYFKNVNTEEKAYWLGFIFADGSLSSKKRIQKTVSVELSVKDKDHLSKLAKIFSVNVKDYLHNDIRTRVISKSCRISITSKLLWESLNVIGITPNKKYRCNTMVWNIIPDNLKSKFLLGFFDGDGCITWNSNTNQPYLCFTGSENILKCISSYISEHAYASYASPFKRKSANVYAVGWSGKLQINRIFELLYKNVSPDLFLSRKYKTFFGDKSQDLH